MFGFWVCVFEAEQVKFLVVFPGGLARMSTTCPDASLGQAVDSQASCSAGGATLRHPDTQERLRHSDTQTIPERVIRSELQQRDGGDGEAVHVIAVCLLRTRREGRAPPFPTHPLTSGSSG